VTITSCKMTACFLQVAVVALCIGAPVHAQSGMDKQPASTSHKLSIHDTRSYQRWLDEDVRWIITPEERAAFIQLKNIEDRDRFIEAFWLRRDPTPGTVENVFKEEHYRRIAYANEHFARDIPGWKTDRGRIYIVYGPPDEIKTESTRSGDDFVRPTEVWHYHSILGYGRNVDLRFVDACGCGDYRLEARQKSKLMPDI
jgi:GWxTD domain-containing protein